MRKALPIAVALLGVAIVVAIVIVTPKLAQRSKPVVATAKPTPTRRNGPVTLAEVRSVFIEPTTSNAVSVDNPSIKFELTKSELLQVVNTKEEADAVFKMTEKVVETDNTRTYRSGPIARVWTRDTKADVDANLTDAMSGAVLWKSTKSKTVSGAPYYGELTGELIRELLAELTKARAK